MVAVRTLRSLLSLTVFVALGSLFVSPTSLSADQSIMIRLEAPDGTVAIQGRLMALEGGFYILETAGLNVMRVENTRIRCVSDICPL